MTDGAEFSESERKSQAAWKAKRERTPRVAAELAAKLQPCPFCRGSAKFGYSYDLEDDGTIYNGCWVECEGCSCEVGRYGPDTMENDNGAFNAFEEAIAAWNRRS